MKLQRIQSYPIADIKLHAHGQIVKCPSCKSIGCLDLSVDGGLVFENAIWIDDNNWFCVECCCDLSQPNNVLTKQNEG